MNIKYSDNEGGYLIYLWKCVSDWEIRTEYCNFLNITNNGIGKV
jgi:hypothetical protein